MMAAAITLFNIELAGKFWTGSMRCGIIGKLFFLWSVCVISELSGNPEVKVTNSH